MYTTGIQYVFRQDVCHCPGLHLQNTQPETAIYLHEHLTLEHFLHVQLCGRPTGNNCTSLAGRSIPSGSFLTWVNTDTCETVRMDMSRVDLDLLLYFCKAASPTFSKRRVPVQTTSVSGVSKTIRTDSRLTHAVHVGQGINQTLRNTLAVLRRFSTNTTDQ